MYFKTDEKVLEETKINDSNISQYYDKGYLFGRIENGYLYQTRALRIDLAKFSLTSENRRILKKFIKIERENLKKDEFFILDNYEISIKEEPLPIKEEIYDWRIHKTGKDFYASKFPESKFSANKIKEILTSQFHFNLLLKYEETSQMPSSQKGYAICYQNDTMTHYCYPFYDLEKEHNNLGMFMMLTAIITTKISGKKYIYLGGVTRPKDKYKLQFEGLEWWDNDKKDWKKDLSELKSLLSVHLS